MSPICYQKYFKIEYCKKNDFFQIFDMQCFNGENRKNPTILQFRGVIFKNVVIRFEANNFLWLGQQKVMGRFCCLKDFVIYSF